MEKADSLDQTAPLRDTPRSQGEDAEQLATDRGAGKVASADDTSKAEEREGQEKAEKDTADDVDPESRIIVEKFDPVLVSLHQDAYIRFWSLEVWAGEVWATKLQKLCGE